MQPTNLLLIHGNGGANARFAPTLEIARQEQPEGLRIHLPLLPGFEGRPLRKSQDYWQEFIGALQTVVATAPDERWVLYGHGIGGSMLLEWAARGWSLGASSSFRPQRVILHSCIGASLQARWFPKLMKPRLMRTLIHRLIYEPVLQQRWERKLFLHPDRIDPDVRQQFFEDYKNCAAFPILFDLITTEWYAAVCQKLEAESFYFLWGGNERVVAAKYLDFWKQDFPNATFEVIDQWDHFPMLDTPREFYDKLMGLTQ